MKSKLTVLVVCATILTLVNVTGGADKSPAVSEGKCLKIGVVSVRKIFADCKRNVKYRQDLSAERDKMAADLEKLSKEIDADKASLKTLKQGSTDYTAMMKEILEKQGKLQALQEFYKRQMDMRESQVIENLFKDVLKATTEVAKTKGLDLVLERSDPDLPASNSNELTLTISTHKVLYDAGCPDITDEVMAKVDANSP
ncbi:MAG: OmpH family outer membrane protein [Sedimentisphaerales bacterium]